MAGPLDTERQLINVVNGNNANIADVLKRVDNQIIGVLTGATAEKISRTGLADDVLQKLALLRPPVDQGEAEIRWGKASRFQITEPDQPTEINYITTTIINNPDDPEPPDGSKVIYYDEFQRGEETIRVENPDDSEQYVMVRRLQWIIFQGRDDGIYRVFTFTNPDAG